MWVFTVTTNLLWFPKISEISEVKLDCLLLSQVWFLVCIFEEAATGGVL